MRLHDYLAMHARQSADRVAVACDGVATTYAELHRRACKAASRYAKGEIVVFRASPTVGFLVDYFAIHIAGAVAVPLEADTPDERFDETKAVLSGASVAPDTADILFTTGTTGSSKGVMISHRAIVATAMNLIEGQGFAPDLCFIVSGPLNHIGSLSKVFPVIVVGASLYLLPGMKGFAAFFDALDHPCAKMATFMVPSALRMLMRFGADKLAAHADKIDFIETGAAPMAHADMMELCALLPRTRLYNTYASTETGVVATYDYNTNECLAGCLGRALPNSQIVITAEGRVTCSGATIMSGYVGDERLTRTVLADGVVVTADRGYLDHEGRLRLLGREDDVINVGGYKISPVEVESVALAMPQIVDCICIATLHPMLGTVAKLLYVAAAGVEVSAKDVARHVAAKLERYKVPYAYEQVEAVKRTYNGKLDRKAYR